MIRETLNKIKWTDKLENYEIEFLHRGLPGDRKVIACERITDIRRGFFSYKNGIEVTIPYHRVRVIRKKSGEVIWEKRS
ncbi:MAG: RNA repair domain-containing protein [Halobacteriota archaeon]|nr:RNA repair domain-containing protein [Halobacteriota archaeon]